MRERVVETHADPPLHAPETLARNRSQSERALSERPGVAKKSGLESGHLPDRRQDDPLEWRSDAGPCASSDDDEGESDQQHAFFRIDHVLSDLDVPPDLDTVLPDHHPTATAAERASLKMASFFVVLFLFGQVASVWALISAHFLAWIVGTIFSVFGISVVMFQMLSQMERQSFQLDDLRARLSMAQPEPEPSDSSGDPQSPTHPRHRGRIAV